MLKIYFVRHGQNEDNANGILNGHRDLPLTDIGRRQARALAEKIKARHMTFDTVLVSPLQRAAETAEIIAGVNHLSQPIIEPKLIERDFGVMTGKAQKKIEKLCAPDIIKTDSTVYFLSPQGAETFPDLMVRARELLNDIYKKYSDGNILLVSHGDFGKILYAEYYHLDWRSVLTEWNLGNAEMLLLSPDSPADEAVIIKNRQN